jgi:hypothetical protein
MSSAFPRTIEQLIPEAERLARELGRIPSQNKLKSALHIRAERAKQVLQSLETTGFDPSAPDTDAHTNGVPSARAEAPVAEPVPDEQPEDGAEVPTVPVNGAREPDPLPRPVRRWPVVLLAAPAFIAIWSAWVGVGELAGFGPVRPLPGIADEFTINSAITLPIGMETYAAYALRVWLDGSSPARARRFARHSAIAAFVLGGLGQIAYHLMKAADMTAAPWPVTTAVSCLPVAVLAFGAALIHLQQPVRFGTEGAR